MLLAAGDAGVRKLPVWGTNVPSSEDGKMGVEPGKGVLKGLPARNFSDRRV